MGNDLFYFSFELWGGIFFLLAALILWIPGRSGGVRKEVVWPVLVTGIMLIADYLAFRFRGGDSELSRVMVYAGNLISILSGFWIAGLFFQYLLLEPSSFFQFFHPFWTRAKLELLL